MKTTTLKRILLILLVVAVATQLTGCGAIKKFFRHPFSFWKDHPDDATLVIPEDLGDTAAFAAGEADTGATVADSTVVLIGPGAQAADSAALAAPDTRAVTATRPTATTPARPGSRPDTRTARPGSVTTVRPPASAGPVTTTFRTVSHRAFRAGEKLTYAISYLGMTAGYFTMEVKTTTYNNRPCYQIISEARTTSGIEWIYRMRDRLVSYVDRAGLFTWRYEKHIDESSDNKQEIFEFNQSTHVLRKPDGGTENIPLYCQDVISAIYFMRAQALQVGGTYTMPCYDGRKLYDLVVRVPKLEVIEVGGTEIPCLMVTPLLKFQGAFRTRGQINMWVTNDERHIPVKMQSSIAVGSFVAELVKVEYTQ